MVGDRVINAIPTYVKLETSLMSYAFPAEKRELGNYLLDALGAEEEEFIATYDLGAFSMRVQSLNRTLSDKVFAVCDYYLQNKAHRIAMGSEIAPAASLDVNILELVQKICNEDFYKEDYRETTLKLISDS